MPAERYFADTPLENGSQVQLVESELHHLLHVMRAKPNDQIELVNGRGDFALAKVAEVKKHHAMIEIISSTHYAPPAYQLTLIQGLPRNNRLDTILEKAVELGVQKIVLMETELSEKRMLQDKQLVRLQTILIAALKQCGRHYLPTLEFGGRLLAYNAPGTPMFFGDISDIAQPFDQAWQAIKPKQQASFITGPESGLTSKECAYLREIGAKGVLLNDATLRTDTASIVALGFMAYWMQFKPLTIH